MMNEKPRMNGNIQRTSSPLARADTTDRLGASSANAGLLHLLVGAALVGADELRDWMRDPDLDPDEAVEQAPRGEAVESHDTLGYAVMGMLFETETTIQRGLSAALSRFARRAHEVNNWYSRFTLEMYQTPFDQPLERFDDLLTRLTDQVDRWSNRGWREERQSRRVAERVFGEAVDELLAYMARNPEVRKLIEQQGMSMAESAADDARARAEAADQWVERLAHGLLRRNPKTVPSAAPALDSSEGAANGASATTPAASGSAQPSRAAPRGASQSSAQPTEAGRSSSRAARAALPAADPSV